MARSEYRRCPPRWATPAGCPGGDRLRGHPHRHIAASNEGLIVGWPVRNAVLRLVPVMDLRLHPCSVAPAEGPEKCGPRRPTGRGSSATTPPATVGAPLRGAASHEAEGWRGARLRPAHRASADLAAGVASRSACSAEFSHTTRSRDPLWTRVHWHRSRRSPTAGHVLLFRALPPAPATCHHPSGECTPRCFPPERTRSRHEWRDEGTRRAIACARSTLSPGRSIT